MPNKNRNSSESIRFHGKDFTLSSKKKRNKMDIILSQQQQQQEEQNFRFYFKNLFKIRVSISSGRVYSPKSKSSIFDFYKNTLFRNS